MKKRILFSTYSIILIIALALFLIFHNQNRNTQEEYAESLIINGPRQITMSINSELEFLNGYIEVLPRGLENNVNLTIKAKSNKNEGGLNYTNNMLLANKIGSYSLSFSVQKAKDKYLTETILVTVVETDNLLSFKTNDLVVDTPTPLNDVLIVNTDATLSISSNDMKIENDTIIATSLAKASLQVDLTKNFVKHIYKSYFQVVAQDNFEVSVYKVEKELLNYKVYISIKNGEFEHTGQDLEVVSCTNVEEIKLTYPIIRVKPKSEGRVEIELALKTDQSIRTKIEFDTRDFD